MVSECTQPNLQGAEQRKINFKYVAAQRGFSFRNRSQCRNTVCWRSEVYIFLFGFLSYVFSSFGVIAGRQGRRIRTREGNLAIPRLYTIHIACQYFWSAARTLLCGLPRSPSILLAPSRNLTARVV